MDTSIKHGHFTVSEIRDVLHVAWNKSDKAKRAIADCGKMWFKRPQRGGKMKSVFKKQVGGTHYRGFKIPPVEFIQANQLGFLEGCVIKRLCRYKNKGGIEDLKKIQHEIDLLIALEYPKYKHVQDKPVVKCGGGGGADDLPGNGGQYDPPRAVVGGGTLFDFRQKRRW